MMALWNEHFVHDPGLTAGSQVFFFIPAEQIKAAINPTEGIYCTYAASASPRPVLWGRWWHKGCRLASWAEKLSWEKCPAFLNFEPWVKFFSLERIWQKMKHSVSYLAVWNESWPPIKSGPNRNLWRRGRCDKWKQRRAKREVVIRRANRALILNYKGGYEARVRFGKFGRKRCGLSFLLLMWSS